MTTQRVVATKSTPERREEEREGKRAPLAGVHLLTVVDCPNLEGLLDHILPGGRCKKGMECWVCFSTYSNGRTSGNTIVPLVGSRAVRPVGSTSQYTCTLLFFYVQSSSVSHVQYSATPSKNKGS